MTTYNTGNPLGSPAAKDLYDNAENFDHLSNDRVNIEWNDRFGVPRKTWYGIEKWAQEAISKYGYITIDSFQDGAELTLPNQVLRWKLPDGDGEYYRWDGEFPKSVPVGSTPETSGGIGAGKWLGVGDAALRTELEDPEGSTKYPEFQLARWRDEGDIRGWGAVCDGVTDDITAIQQAISDTGGHIVIPHNIFISTHLLVKDKTNPTVEFRNGADLTIDTNFIFADKYRGIIVFDGCSNPKVTDAIIVGAKLDKFNGGVDPVADGDSGIEYMYCTGLCHSVNPNIKDVKGWGIIHINIDDYHVENPVMTNCQVQSGVGGTGVKSALVTNPLMKYIGLYGVEFETVESNQRGAVIGGIISNTQKGIGIVNNSPNIDVTGTRVINSLVGISCTGSASQSTLNPKNLTIMSTKTISCKIALELINTNDATIKNNICERDDIDFYSRVSAYDRIYRFDSGAAYIPVYSGSPAPVVGLKIMLDSGAEHTISAVTGNITDPVFGNLIGFTCTPALTASCLRRSFSRYVEITSSQTGVVLQGGDRNEISECVFKDLTTLIASYGSHTRLKWDNNTARAIVKYFDSGLPGTVSGSMEIETKDCENVNWGPAYNKFSPAFTAMRLYNFKGGASANDTSISNAITIDDGILSGASCAINGGQTTTGVIVLRVNGTDVISGGFSGTPLRRSVTFPTVIGVGGAAIIQLTDTVGDLITSGYSVKLLGAFKK
ncbi:tail fiber/spike domain-containing protein [Limnobaculum parvum]|uniref:tail fiber/spike domain-containing protein n=1 Tax=Limnobaculum parvum TaxID=2172103 RepID=UPI0013003601|nr:hypothetical protein [Limnobaculum parvum]